MGSARPERLGSYKRNDGKWFEPSRPFMICECFFVMFFFLSESARPWKGVESLIYLGELRREEVPLRGIVFLGSWSALISVAHVHGWGLRSVRLVCSSASSEEQAERYRLFFQRDRRNLEGRLVSAVDPLDSVESQ